MKKFVKLSLVAAVAVAGLTTANATPLEEAIKGVDISGQFRYRFQDRSGENLAADAASDNISTDVEVELTAKVPVNDMVTAVMKFDTTRNTASNGTTTQDFIDVEDYYFQYVNGATTVLAGQQNIPGRMTDGHQGNGLVALYNAGEFTVGAAAFADHSVTGTVSQGNNIYSVIAMGTVGPVSLLAQYATVEDTLDAYNLKADASIEAIKVGLEYTDLELDDVAAKALTLTTKKDDRSTFKAYVSGSIDAVSAKLTYASTGKNGSGSIDNQTMTEVETPAEFLLWNLGTAKQADMDVVAIDASIKLTDTVSLRGAYADGEIGNAAGNSVDEALIQVSYQMSKNLSTYVRYSTYDSNATSDNADKERGRVEVKYSF